MAGGWKAARAAVNRRIDRMIVTTVLVASSIGSLLGATVALAVCELLER
ncbi:hypothetical protein [uncultured Sphingomonas sp.]